METILMENTEREIELKNYLESLGIDVSEYLEIWGHKHLVNVMNEDRFNQLTQLSNVKQIRDDGDLTFHIRYKNNPWIIALVENERKEFLIKYGINYQLI